MLSGARDERSRSIGNSKHTLLLKVTDPSTTLPALILRFGRFAQDDVTLHSAH
jgi:hypothetical protein